MVVTLCFVCTWTLIIFACCRLWAIGKEGITRLKRLHQIPCSRCQFFTGDYRLKCTVYPIKALSEDAIDCLDYEPQSYADMIARKSSLHKKTFSLPNDNSQNIRRSTALGEFRRSYAASAQNSAFVLVVMKCAKSFCTANKSVRLSSLLF